MSAYVGIQTQISKNNFNSVLLLISFPLLILGMVYVFIALTSPEGTDIVYNFLKTVPFVILGVGIWFLIAFFSHTAIINMATGARPLARRENMRVYNLVENLCISQGMSTPKIFILEDDSLNAYASGINEKSYAVTLSRGIINKLDDAELEGVIAHELAHIKNKDVRLLIISIVFVGIFALLSDMAFRSFLYGGMGNRRRNDKDGGGAYVILIAMVITAVAYFISLLLRFGISRSREYMADAGATEMTRNPRALASALRKISGDPYIEAVKNNEVAQLFIEHPASKKKSSFSLQSLFATHPPIEKRIERLENF